MGKNELVTVEENTYPINDKNFGIMDKEFKFKKGMYKVIKEETILTAKKEIKQNALKFYLAMCEFAKTKEHIRKLIINAIDKGYEIADGELIANVNEGKAPELFDKESAIDFIARHGGDIDEFFTTGKPKKTLDIR